MQNCTVRLRLSILDILHALTQPKKIKKIYQNSKTSRYLSNHKLISSDSFYSKYDKKDFISISNKKNLDLEK